MDRIAKLAVSTTLSWVALSAYLTGGESLWSGWTAVPDWGKALAALAGFQLAPYIPDLVTRRGIATGASTLLQRLIVIAAPAFAAMTVAAGAKEGFDEWRVGASAAGLVAAWLVYRGMGQQGRAAGQASGVPKEWQAAETELRKTAASIARRTRKPRCDHKLYTSRTEAAADQGTTTTQAVRRSHTSRQPRRDRPASSRTSWPCARHAPPLTRTYAVDPRACASSGPRRSDP